MSDFSDTLAAKVERVVRDYGHVSFIDFERLLPEIRGTETMSFVHPTLVLWTNVSGAFIDTMANLMTSKRVFMWADPDTWAYALDGGGLALPEARRVMSYKSSRWLKATFHHEPPTLASIRGTRSG